MRQLTVSVLARTLLGCPAWAGPRRPLALMFLAPSEMGGELCADLTN